MGKFLRQLPYPLWIAVVMTVLVLLTLDAGGRGPAKYLDAPGATLDESFNIQQGYFLWAMAGEYGISIIDPRSVEEIFSHELYLEDHPPLGRLWLGFVHQVLQSTLSSPQQIDYTFGRAASALAYGFLILMCGAVASRWWGRSAGFLTALCIACMPRLFGHAHLGSLEMCVNVSYCAVVLFLAEYWVQRTSLPTQITPATVTTVSPSFWQRMQFGYFPVGMPIWVAFVAGVLWGMALLTKIQGVFVPFPIILYGLIVWRQRAILPLLIMGVTGLSVFFVSWPWLWLDPVPHLMQYFGRSVNRLVVHNYYLGHVYDDKQTPWHYPWVMFLLTTPLLLQAGGVWALIKNMRVERRVLFLGLNVMLPLIFFSLPLAKYDGERLFQFVFPLWCMLAGYGLAQIMAWGMARNSKLTIATYVVCFTSIFISSFVIHPCQINSYNVLGCLINQRVSKPNLEVSYWGDSLSASWMREALAKVDHGSTVFVCPVMHQFQLPDLIKVHPEIQQKSLTLLAYGSPEWNQALAEVSSPEVPNTASKKYLLTFQRLADLPVSELKHLDAQHRLETLSLQIRSHVEMARLSRLHPSVSNPNTNTTATSSSIP
jgi:hypothetical protein